MEKIDSTIITLIVTTVTSLFAVLVSLRSFLKTKKMAEVSGVNISDARNHLENKIYSYSFLLNSDPIRFANANHLFLACGNKRLGLNSHLRDDSFFEDLGINLNSLGIKKHMALCLMPFNKRFDSTYSVIKQACKTCGFDCNRSDEPVAPGSILKQIVEMILEAQIIIALIDGRNPNVFYEIGIAHALGKNVILVSDLTDKDIPFDLRSKRFVFYHSKQELTRNLSQTLKGLR